MFIMPYKKAEAELKVQNSRFIARLFPVFSTEEARKLIADVKASNLAAAHNVPAFIIGSANNTTEYCSDDGEPSGSSGKPLLNVLKGSGLGNVLIVVSRYFGGTLLGIGGLVRAYSDSGKAVLSKTERAELVPASSLSINLPYPLYEKTKLLLNEYECIFVEETFNEEVFIKVDIATSVCPSFVERLKELSGGKLAPHIEKGEPRARLLS